MRVTDDLRTAMFARLDTHVLLLTACLAVGACDSTLAAIDVANGCPDQPIRRPEAGADEPASRLIDDFEDGDTFLQAEEGRDGPWVTGHDDSQGTTVFEIAPKASPNCSARGHGAARFAWSGYTLWGANLTAVFRQASGTTAATWDGRAYGGVSFWAALPAGRAPFDLPVGVMTIDNAWNGGVCANNAGKCMDDYATKVHLTPRWERFDIRFDQMQQAGFGDPLVPMRKDKLVGLVFWPRRPTEFWLDDVRFEP